MNQLPIRPTPEQAMAWYHDVVAAEGRLPNRILEKSALYQRLLDGKKPLIASPPLVYSYPWYSIVENDQPQDIDQPFTCAEGLYVEADGLDRVLISQSLWEVVSRDGEESLTVTWPGWRELGFVWRAWRELQPAAAAKAYLISHHDPALGRITTLAQLDAEARFQAVQWRGEYAIAREWRLGLTDEASAVDALYAFHGHRDGAQRERFLKRATRQKLQHLGELFDARLRAFMPDAISDEELEERVVQERAMLLGENWRVLDGQLFFDGWRLQRIAPAGLTASHYRELPPLAEVVNG